MADSVLIGVAPEGPQTLALKRANRHGLVAGATGTGKTVTLQVLAEQLAKEGVAVFCADVKGDLCGIAAAGEPPPAWAAARAAEIKLENYTPEAAPVVFWDLYGQQGHPVRTTVTEMGPILMARILDATEAQEGAITIAFKLADDWLKEGKQEGLLLDMKDLRALLTHMSENAEAIGKKYGLVTPTTIAALQRKLLQLEMDGAEIFFGEPALEIADLIRTTPEGKGVVNVLMADKLVQSPRLYATFLLWLLSELWESLPEAGDLPKPKLVFFFDEAHLLFNDAPKELLDRVEQVARLIRSKGVGVYFITQSPSDVPDMVLSQLGNRIQHALRAYTPADQKAVRAAAQSFRANPGVDVAKEIQELHVGEALVSVLDDKGAPTPVARTLIRPPASRVGPVTPGERAAIINACPLAQKYAAAVDRRSAYEILSARAAEAQAEEEAEAARAEREKERERAARTPAKTARPRTSGGSRTSAAERVGGRVASNVLNTVTRELMRGIFGTPRRRTRR
ncbi:MAG: helicase HerA-like domain-containing protein [Hyphomonadaceae bacterium]